MAGYQLIIARKHQIGLKHTGSLLIIGYKSFKGIRIRMPIDASHSVGNDPVGQKAG
ncbi:hypothetical protein D3C87_1820650 [compost metagenome]